jgi:hypothetical protein
MDIKPDFVALNLPFEFSLLNCEFLSCEYVSDLQRQTWSLAEQGMLIKQIRGT